MSEVTNKKMLKGTRRVSDVEIICAANHERRKSAEQYDGQYTDFGQEEIATVAALPRNDRETDCHSRKRLRNDKRRGVLRTVCTACAMATGCAAAFVGIGLCMGHLLTVVVGSLVAATFLICGTSLEEAVYREGRKEHV